MKFRNALVAATILALPFAANAQPVTGLYVGAGVGPDLQLNTDVKNLQIGSGPLGGLSTSGQEKYSTGFAGLASIGWGLGNGFRAEVEGNYLQTNGNGFTGFTRFGGFNGGGKQEKYGGFVNGLYDFVGLIPVVQPYVGAGVGIQWVDNNTHAYNTNFVTARGETFNPGTLDFSSQGTKAVFAYQAILGAAVPIDAIPGLALTAEYRFIGTAGNRSQSATFTGQAVGSKVATAVPGNAQFGPTYDNAILFGVRYNFGVAPPPPAPAPAAVAPSPVSRSYLVFFDWDKYNLTDRARQIVAEAAANSTKVQYTRLEVNGYTDTSGSAKYNMGLSVRRAQAVAAELVKNGVPKSAISIQGFGETHLLVPTGPNVREPQNRRVEIIIK
jgi:outer membrane protein OmpA-like peptidoglycan-associated protein